MSHVAQVDVKFTNVEAIKRACQRMGASFCGKAIVKYYDDTEIGGNVVQLAGWEYPITIKPDGTLYYDNYEGQWGAIEQLNQFKQLYTIEAAKIAAENEGYVYTEETLPSGVLKLTIETE